MTMQMMMDVPKIDVKKTREKVESLLEQYRMFLVTMPKDILPKLTAGYSIVPPNFSNQFRSSTEDVAIERIEWEEKRNSFIQMILDAVEQLKHDEKFIIFKSFLDDNVGYDCEIWDELHIGKTKYYRIKSEALLRLGFILKVEVYRK